MNETQSATEKELEQKIIEQCGSACCGAEILMADNNGHGKCSQCYENTTPYEPTPEEMEYYKRNQ